MRGTPVEAKEPDYRTGHQDVKVIPENAAEVFPIIFQLIINKISYE